MKKISGCIVTMVFCWSILPAQNYVPEWGDKRIKVQPATRVKAWAFNISDVKLLEGPFTEAMNRASAYLLTINPDRLLADFRAHSGLEPRGERYGGWESSGLAGHTLGHYLSAISIHYASTGDPEFLRRANYIVDELEQCQHARKSGYVGAIPKEDSLWMEVAEGRIRSKGFDLNGAWSPWYTVHKIMAGLLDAYLYTHNEKALAIDEAMADWAGRVTRNLNDSLFQKMLITEYGGMNDVLVNTWALTNKKEYLDLSYRFYDRRIMDSLAANIDILPGKHSNTQIPKVIGSARRYQLTGDEKDNTIARFFWETIVNHHSYATGGNSNYEYLGRPDSLNDQLTDNTTETCNTYNMLKLTRQIFAVSPSSTLMDYYEKALYNHILASQNHATGMVTYFVPLRMGGRKEYSEAFNSFTCCVGTGMENHIKYAENIYTRGSDGSLYINLFIPSVLNWKERKLSVKQQSALPWGNRTSFLINTAIPSRFTMRIRKPAWCKSVQVKINGQLQYTGTGEDGYLALDREWKNNDLVELFTPLSLHTTPMPDNPHRVAIFYGPVLLAGVFGQKEPDPLKIPVLVSNERDPAKWVKKMGQGRNFITTAGTPGNVKLIPFNRTADEHYSVYWDVFTPGEWRARQKLYEAAKQKERQLEARTVDMLRIGEMQPERDHELTSSKSATGEEHNRKWRIAEDSGYISFVLKSDPSAQNVLVFTYWGMDNRGRVFDILVNGKKIATEDLSKYKSSKFYEIGYPVPLELSRYKLSLNIQLLPKPSNAAGPIYGVKNIRGAFDSQQDLTR
jgi:DUF1680 family protein